MKKNKKNKKEKKMKNLRENLRYQADEKNMFDCQPYLDELDQASKEGEYSRILQLKVNQARYLELLGLDIEKQDKIGYYKISW
jgi:hypothetical protein